MSRSNKEARLNHSGYSIETGHGGMKRNMGAGASIKPQSEESSGMARAKARQAAPKTEEPAETKKPEMGDYEGKSGWSAIGQAGADIVKTYQANKAASAAK